MQKELKIAVSSMFRYEDKDIDLYCKYKERSKYLAYLISNCIGGSAEEIYKNAVEYIKSLNIDYTE